MSVTLHLGDCLEYMRGMEDNSIDAVVTDPPYYRVKADWWDRQWDTPVGFLAWLDEVLAEVYRIMRPNGSLYLFASPQMAARVEVLVGKRLNVLNGVTWFKSSQSYAEKYGPETFRKFVPMSERIIFAEHYGADGYAKGEAGYGAKCDELRGFVFEPIRAYLDGERIRANVGKPEIDAAWQSWKGGRGGMSSHWFSVSQWTLPTCANYEWLRETFARMNHGGEYLRREYEDLRREYEDLRREYEDLRREYEDLRRPFAVTPDVPYTDVWTFPTVAAYPGKHPTEKPLDLMRHIVQTSTREGMTVFDPFAGSGTTGLACVKTGRNFAGCEIDPGYFAIARRRIADAQAQLPLLMEGMA